MSENNGENYLESRRKEDLYRQKQSILLNVNDGDLYSIFGKHQISDEEIREFFVKAGISDEDVMVVNDVKGKAMDYILKIKSKKI